MEQKIILGMGSGRCGTFSLPRLLGMQPECVSTHEEPPLLPWRREPGERVIRARFARFRRTRRGRLLASILERREGCRSGNRARGDRAQR